MDEKNATNNYHSTGRDRINIIGSKDYDAILVLSTPKKDGMNKINILFKGQKHQLLFIQA